MKLLGIEIESKTDILAASAFILSVGSLFAQAVIILKGSHVKIEGPRQVLISSLDYGGGEKYIMLAAETTYVNVGTPSFADVLKEESARLAINNRSLKFISDDIVDLDSDSGKLIVKRESSWKPVQLGSGEVKTLVTSFVPQPDENGDATSYVKPEEFIGLIKAMKPSDAIDFSLKATTFNGQEITYSCNLRVGDFIEGFSAKGWSAPLCRNPKIFDSSTIGDLLGRLFLHASGER